MRGVYETAEWIDCRIAALLIHDAPICTREHKNLDVLLALLAPFDIKVVYSDSNSVYQWRVTGSEVLMGKENTQKIERSLNL